jgi:hypothetical protein
MSNRNRRDYGTEDSLFMTGLWMGLNNSNLRFYTGEEDDEIDPYGGKFLSISGVFLRGSNKYVLIEYACVPIYFADGGHRLNILTAPYVMDAKTFKPVSMETLRREGLTGQVNRAQGYSAPTEQNLQDMKEMSMEAALPMKTPEYIAFLFAQQGHIKECAQINKRARNAMPVTPMPIAVMA